MRACDAGDAAAARELGQSDAGSGAGTLSAAAARRATPRRAGNGRASLAGARFDEAERSFRSGCDRGHGSACLGWGTARSGGARRRAAVSYRKACDEDVAAGCRALASALMPRANGQAAELYGTRAAGDADRAR